MSDLMLRERAAIAALQGLMSRPDLDHWTPEILAERATWNADALVSLLQATEVPPAERQAYPRK